MIFRIALRYCHGYESFMAVGKGRADDPAIDSHAHRLADANVYCRTDANAHDELALIVCTIDPTFRLCLIAPSVRSASCRIAKGHRLAPGKVHRLAPGQGRAFFMILIPTNSFPSSNHGKSETMRNVLPLSQTGPQLGPVPSSSLSFLRTLHRTAQPFVRI